MSTVSYTLRMSSDLVDKLDAEAAQEGLSRAAMVQLACRLYFDRKKDSGVAQMEEQVLSKSQVAGSSPASAAKQKRMPPAKRLPDGPDGDHRFDRSNQPPLLDSTIKASPLLPKIEAKSKVVVHDGGASLYVQTPAEVMDRLQGLSRHHDRKTCRIYKCGMCAASKG
jgi:hypothetical protein